MFYIASYFRIPGLPMEISWSPSPLDVVESPVPMMWSPSPLDDPENGHWMSLDSLPDTVIIRLFEIMEIRECLTLARCCKRLWKFVNTITFWEMKLWRDHKCTANFRGKSKGKLPFLRETYVGLTEFPFSQ